MTSITRRTKTVIPKIVTTLALAVAAAGLFAGPALADDDRGHGRGRHERFKHERHDREWREHHPVRIVPGYVYAPPAVTYAPPPPPPAINFVFPVHLY